MCTSVSTGIPILSFGHDLKVGFYLNRHMERIRAAEERGRILLKISPFRSWFRMGRVMVAPTFPLKATFIKRVESSRWTVEHKATAMTE